MNPKQIPPATEGNELYPPQNLDNHEGEGKDPSYKPITGLPRFRTSLTLISHQDSLSCDPRALLLLAGKPSNASRTQQPQLWLPCVTPQPPCCHPAPRAQHRAPSSDCQLPHGSCSLLSPPQEPLSGIQQAQNQQGDAGVAAEADSVTQEWHSSVPDVPYQPLPHPLALLSWFIVSVEDTDWVWKF